MQYKTILGHPFTCLEVKEQAVQLKSNLIAVLSKALVLIGPHASNPLTAY